MDPSKESGAPKGHVAVRLDPPTIARIDALLPLYALPGREPTRSDALRALILAGFEVEERRTAQLRREPDPSSRAATSSRRLRR